MAKSKKKFYAVKKGRMIGIFNNWEECKEAVDGYSGSEYKGFSTQYEAEAYLQGKKLETVQYSIPNSSNQKEAVEDTCFYAVKKGWKSGIFKTWKGCWQAIDGYSGSEVKGFTTEAEAVKYMYETDYNISERKTSYPINNEDREFLEDFNMDESDEYDFPFA